MKPAFTVVVTGQSLITQDVRHVRDEGFEEVIRFLKQGDVVFTNFESTILGRYGGWPTKGKYFGYSEPVVLDALKEMGFNTLALANNHAFDLGPNGVLSTLQEVIGRDFFHAGIGIDQTRAAVPGRRRFGTRNVSLVAMDAGPGPSNMYAEDAKRGRPARPGVNRLKTSRRFEIPAAPFDALSSLMTMLQSSDLERANYAQPEDPPSIEGPDQLDFYGTVLSRSDTCGRFVEVDQQSASMHLGAIGKAAKQGDFVIAYLHHHHWEPDWQEVPRWVQSFARACVDAGADLFVSHGAPVLQAMETYKGSPIFYGLGNFLFHTDPEESEWRPPEVWESIVAACHYDDAEVLVGIDLVPIAIEMNAEAHEGTAVRGLIPNAMTGDDANRILARFAERSCAFYDRIEREGDAGRIGASQYATSQVCRTRKQDHVRAGRPVLLFGRIIRG